MSCFCQRPSGLSPHIYRKIEVLEQQIATVFHNCIIDLFVVRVNRPLSQSNKDQPEIQLIYRTNMDDIRNSEETRIMSQIITAINNFAYDFRPGFKYNKLHIKGSKCIFSLYSLSNPSLLSLEVGASSAQQLDKMKTASSGETTRATISSVVGNNSNSSNNLTALARQGKDYAIAFYSHFNRPTLPADIDTNNVDRHMERIILDFAHLLQNITK